MTQRRDQESANQHEALCLQQVGQYETLVGLKNPKKRPLCLIEKLIEKWPQRPSQRPEQTPVLSGYWTEPGPEEQRQKIQIGNSFENYCSDSLSTRVQTPVVNIITAVSADSRSAYNSC